jgi:hypothetical protein
MKQQARQLAPHKSVYAPQPNPIPLATLHAPPHSKIIPVIVPAGTDNQKFRWRGFVGIGGRR